MKQLLCAVQRRTLTAVGERRHAAAVGNISDTIAFTWSMFVVGVRGITLLPDRLQHSSFGTSTQDKQDAELDALFGEDSGDDDYDPSAPDPLAATGGDGAPAASAASDEVGSSDAFLTPGASCPATPALPASAETVGICLESGGAADA